MIRFTTICCALLMALSLPRHASALPLTPTLNDTSGGGQFGFSASIQGAPPGALHFDVSPNPPGAPWIPPMAIGSLAVTIPVTPTFAPPFVMHDTLTINGVTKTFDATLQFPFGGVPQVQFSPVPLLYDLGNEGTLWVYLGVPGLFDRGTTQQGRLFTGLVTMLVSLAPNDPEPPTPVPEPTSLLLLGSGLLAMAARRRPRAR